MPAPSNVEDQNMAKHQRAIQLPKETFTLTEAFERQSGAKFNRQALAAFLQFFFSNPRGPDAAWMRAAVSVEKGELPLAMVGLELAKRRVINAVAHARVMKGAVDAGQANPLAMDECYSRLHEARAAFDEWEAALKRADDPLKALFTYWAERAPSPIVFVTPHPDGTEERITAEELRRAEYGAAEEGEAEPPPEQKKK